MTMTDLLTDAFQEVEPFKAEYARRVRINSAVGWTMVAAALTNFALVLCWFLHWLPVPGWVTQYGGCVVAAIATVHLYTGHQRRRAHVRMMEKHSEVFARTMRSFKRADWPVRVTTLGDK